MKKLIIIAFIAIGLVGCQKDEVIAPDISVVGTWKVQSYIYEYYTSGNVKDLEQNATNDNDTMDKIVFTASSAVITDNSNFVENSGYTLSSSNGKTYLHFTNPSVSTVDQIEVSVSGSQLNMVAELQNAQYVKNGQNKVAPKALLKIQFSKQ